MCRLFIGNMNYFQRDIIFFCSLLYSWYPIICKRTLVSIINNKSFFRYVWVLCTFLKFRRFCIFAKRQIHQVNSCIRCIGNSKSLVCHIFRIWQKLFFSFIRRKYANTLFPFCFCVTNTLRQQIIWISVSFHCSGNPKTVDINISVRFNRNPCIFSRNILYKTLSSFHTAIKHKPLIKAFFQPFLFLNTLLARHRTTNMLFIYIFICYSHVFHKITSTNLRFHVVKLSY